MGTDDKRRNEDVLFDRLFDKLDKLEELMTGHILASSTKHVEHEQRIGEIEKDVDIVQKGIWKTFSAVAVSVLVAIGHAIWNLLGQRH
jgi:hypothetical protein